MCWIVCYSKAVFFKQLSQLYRLFFFYLVPWSNCSTVVYCTSFVFNQTFATNVQQLGLLYRLCIYLYVPFNKCLLFVYWTGCVFTCALKYVFNRCLLYVQVLSLTMPLKCSIVVAIVQAMPCRYCSRVVYCIGCLF